MKIVREYALAMLANLSEHEAEGKLTPKWYQRLYYEQGCVRGRLVSALVDLSIGLKGNDKLKHVRMAKHELLRQILIDPESQRVIQSVTEYLSSDLQRHEIASMYGVELSECEMFYREHIRNFKPNWCLGGNGTSSLIGELVRGVHVPSWLPDLLEPSECVEWFQRVEEVWCGEAKS